MEKYCGIETLASPKNVFKKALDLDLINEEEFKIFYRMAQTRNLTSHTYNQSLAEQVSKVLTQYHELMLKVATKFESNISSG